MVVAALAAAVVAVLAVGTPMVVHELDQDDAPSAAAPSPRQGTQPGTQPGDVVSRPMAPVGDVPVEASLGLEQVKWGTRLLLTCSYEPQSVKYDLPPAVDYTLFVRTRAGRTEQVGSWRSIGGTTMHLAAATSSNRGDIESVEVRTPDGRVVLRLRA